MRCYLYSFPRLIIVFALTLSTLVLSDFDTFKFLIFNMTDYVKDKNLVEFHNNQFGNFSHFLFFGNVFVVSKGNTILKMKSDNLEQLEKHPLEGACDENFCEKIKISFLTHSDGILLFCYVVKQIRGKEDSKAMCKIADTDKIRMYGNFHGTYHSSDDFDHRSAIIMSGNYIYSGIYSNMRKQLHLIKNPRINGPENAADTRLEMPQSFFKSHGDFIMSFKHDSSIYFLYLETDFNCINQRNEIQTRLVQLCDYDIGNSQNSFSLFGKVTVVCKQSKENRIHPPFLYRIASDATWSKSSNNLIVTFVSGTADNNINGNISSAVCVYSIVDVMNAFKSKLKKDSEKVEYIDNTVLNEACKVSMDKNKIDEYHTLSKSYPFRQNSVSSEALFVEHSSKFVKVTSTNLNLFNGKREVFFVATESIGRFFIIQINLKPDCISKRYLLSDAITFLDTMVENGKQFLIIGTNRSMIKLPMNYCETLTTTQTCALEVNCKWNMNRCVENEVVSSGSPFLPSCVDLSTITKDSLLNDWKKCNIISLNESKGFCKCKNVNSKSSESWLIEIADCTVNGGWTPFSPWSACSVTCGKGYQQKQRSCSFPFPQNGGQNCNGSSSETRICTTNITCEDKKDKNYDVYSPWSSWSPCSETCGFSFQSRSRSCLKQNLCSEDLHEQKLCSTPSCTEIKETVWTPFRFHEFKVKRSRFKCLLVTHSKKASPSIILHTIKSPWNLSCSNAACLRHGAYFMNGTLSEWSHWSPCKKPCGYGYKERFRNCSHGSCLGLKSEFETCNFKPCVSHWSCWSEWSTCPKTCETQQQRNRSRRCVYDRQNTKCNGNSFEESECSLKQCEQKYSQWSDWSKCNDEGFMTRSRKCLSQRPCLFPLMNNRPCIGFVKSQTVKYSSMYMIVSGLVGLLVGTLVACAINYIWWRCTVSVIKKTSLKLSSTYVPADGLETPYSVYNSQSIQYLPGSIPGSCRQRSYSNNEYDLQPSSEYHHLQMFQSSRIMETNREHQ